MSWTLPCDVLCLGLANGGRNISRSLKLLCLKRNIGNLSAIQEKSGYLLRQRGNELFVGKCLLKRMGSTISTGINVLIDPLRLRRYEGRQSRHTITL